MTGPTSPPLVKGEPLLGCARLIARNPTEFTGNATSHHGGIVAFRLPGRTLYATSDPDIAERVLITETEKFDRGSRIRLLGKSIFTVSDDNWRKHRRLASPAFHHERITEMMSGFIRLAEDVDRRWQANEGKQVLLTEEMRRFAVTVIGEVLFHTPVDTEFWHIPDIFHRMMVFMSDRTYALARLPLGLPMPKFRRFRKDVADLDRRVFHLIEQRRASRSPHGDLFDMLIAATDEDTGKPLSLREIRDELLAFLVAGHETTSLALSWLWYFLGKHPDIRKRMVEEHDRVIGEGPVRPDHLGQLVYTRQVITETLRLRPPAVTMFRDVRRDCEVGGTALKGGMPFMINVHQVHRHPDHWPDPERFDPDRFSPENESRIAKTAFLTFGAGLRTCIGSQFAIYEILAHIAVLGRTWQPVVAPEYVPKIRVKITATIEDGLPVHLDRTRT